MADMENSSNNIHAFGFIARAIPAQQSLTFKPAPGIDFAGLVQSLLQLARGTLLMFRGRVVGSAESVGYSVGALQGIPNPSLHVVP